MAVEIRSPLEKHPRFEEVIRYIHAETDGVTVERLMGAVDGLREAETRMLMSFLEKTYLKKEGEKLVPKHASAEDALAGKSEEIAVESSPDGGGASVDVSDDDDPFGDGDGDSDDDGSDGSGDSGSGTSSPSDSGVGSSDSGPGVIDDDDPFGDNSSGDGGTPSGSSSASSTSSTSTTASTGGTAPSPSSSPDAGGSAATGGAAPDAAGAAASPDVTTSDNSTSTSTETSSGPAKTFDTYNKESGILILGGNVAVRLEVAGHGNPEVEKHGDDGLFPYGGKSYHAAHFTYPDFGDGLMLFDPDAGKYHVRFRGKSSAVVEKFHVKPDEVEAFFDDVRTVAGVEEAMHSASDTSQRESGPHREIIDLRGEVLRDVVDIEKLRDIALLELDGAEAGQVLQEMRSMFAALSEGEFSKLEETLAPFGYTVESFVQMWASHGAEQVYNTMLKPWIEQQKVTAAQASISLLDRAKYNASGRAKQVIARTGAVMGSAALTALGISGLGGSGKIVGGFTGAVAGFVRGLTKHNRGVQEFMKEQEKGIQKKREDLVAERTQNEQVLESLRERLGDDEFDIALGEIFAQGITEMSTTHASKRVDNETYNTYLDQGAANPALMQVRIARRIQQAHEDRMEGGTTTEEYSEHMREVQNARLDTLVVELYADNSVDLILKVLSEDDKFFNAVKNMKEFAMFDWDKIVSRYRRKKIQPEEYSDIKRNVLIALNTVGGATVGTLIGGSENWRIFLSALSGGYLGGQYAEMTDRSAREDMLREKVATKMDALEEILEDIGMREELPDDQEFADFLLAIVDDDDDTEISMVTADNPGQVIAIGMKALTSELRTPLTLGLLKHDLGLELRVKHALRTIEHIMIEESLRDGRVEGLLEGLKMDTQSVKKKQEKTQKDLSKTNKWRTASYVVGGVVAGALVGTLWHEYRQSADTGGSNEQEGAVLAQVGTSEPHYVSPEELRAMGLEQPTGQGVAAPAPTSDPQYVSPEELRAMGFEQPDTIEVAQDIPNTPEAVRESYGREPIGRGEGPLHAINRLLASHEHGMDKGEVHTFRYGSGGELARMGFVWKDGKLGWPFTVHEGAEVELYMGGDDELHVRLVATEGETVTLHDTVHFKEATAEGGVPTEEMQETERNSEAFANQVNEYADNVEGAEPASVTVDEGLHDDIMDGSRRLGVIEADADIYHNRAVKITLEGGDTLAVHVEPGDGENRWHISPAENSPFFGTTPADTAGATETSAMTPSDIEAHPNFVEPAEADSAPQGTPGAPPAEGSGYVERGLAETGVRVPGATVEVTYDASGNPTGTVVREEALGGPETNTMHASVYNSDSVPYMRVANGGDTEQLMHEIYYRGEAVQQLQGSNTPELVALKQDLAGYMSQYAEQYGGGRSIDELFQTGYVDMGDWDSGNVRAAA